MLVIVFFVIHQFHGQPGAGVFCAIAAVVGSKAGFAVLSVRLLQVLSVLCPEIDLAELARMYSAEVEYSTENLDVIFEELML